MIDNFDFDVVTGPSRADQPRACAIAAPREAKAPAKDTRPAPKAEPRE